MKKTVVPLCKQMARKKLLESKMQSFCIIVAVVLTTILFTTTFSTLFYFNHSIRKAELENIGWTAHGAIAEVTEEQYHAMKQSKVISEISYYMQLGFLEERGQDEVIEMQYCEDDMGSWMYYSLSQGHMPNQENEIAVSSQFLANKGIAFEKGKQIMLQYSVNGELRSKEFVLSGVYEKKATSAEVAFISEIFFEKEFAQTIDEEKKDSVLGTRVVEVMLQNTTHMERDMKKLLEESNAEQNSWMLNEVYLTGTQLNMRVIFAVVCVLVLIMLCGYFIIYNIYYISVMQDTRFYGSLSTLGFRADEICQLVKHKTNILCIISIPLGLVLGFVFSMSFLPNVLEQYGNETLQTFPNPLLFVCAAVFSYITVCISSKKPADIAAKMSPIEAKKYVSVKVTGKKNSRNGYRMSVMACKNIVRERKRSILICCSLSVCIILTSLFYTISRGLNLELFLKDVISCDFIVGSETYFSKVGGSYEVLDDYLVQNFAQWEGINESGGAHVTLMDVPLDNKAYAKYLEIVGEQDTNQNGMMYTGVYGLDEYVFRKMTALQGELDWNKFKTGDYVIANCFVESGGTQSCYEIGDKVKLLLADGVEKEYTVLAIGDIPYDMSLRERYACSVELFLPAQEWSTRMQSNEYFVYAYDIEDTFEALWEKELSDLKKGDIDFSYESKMTFRNQFEGFVNGILMLGTCISVILGTIGLLNFVNVIYSSIHNRKRELAIMQSIGMSRKQIYSMLITEGSYYILISWIVGIVVGMLLNYLVVTSLEHSMGFVQYECFWLPYIIFGVIGCFLAVCVPGMIFYMLDKKEDLLCRLHKRVA